MSLGCDVQGVGFSSFSAGRRAVGSGLRSYNPAWLAKLAKRLQHSCRSMVQRPPFTFQHGLDVTSAMAGQIKVESECTAYLVQGFSNITFPNQGVPK